MTDQNQEPTTVQDNPSNSNDANELDGLIEGGANLFNDDGSFKQNTIVEDKPDTTSADSKEPANNEPKGDDSNKEPTNPDDSQPADKDDKSGTQPKETDKAPDSTDDKKEGTDNKPFLTVKYNKKDMELSQEDAITLAQKGMNYDHLQDKVNSMSKVNNRLEEQAKLNGMTVDEYLDKLDEVQREFEYNNALEKVKKEYPEADEKLLERMVKAEIEASRKDKESNKVNTETKIAEDRQVEYQKQIDRFLNTHKDIKVDQLEDILTDDMYKLMDQGYTISEAYDAVKGKETAKSNSAAQAQAAANQKKADNKSKSMGNVSNSGNDEGKDVLVEAFVSAFK